MPLDPEVVAFLDAVREARLPTYADLPPAEARELFRTVALKRRGDAPGDPVAATEDTEADGVPVRIYRPAGEARAALTFFHGGGWVIGDLDTHDVQARALCARAGVTVVSVDYRLAPEHPFPAAVDDALAATRWTARNLPRWGLDRLVVGGDSAGGNLAAVVALEARRGVPADGPELAAQVLIYPAVDLTLSHPSVEELAEGYYLERRTMHWFVDHYLDGADPRARRASPLFAGDLSGLPPAVVVTAEYDPLRDEGEAYARALARAGVPVRVTRHPGLIHGFFGMGGLVAAAQAAIDATCRELVALLEDGARPAR